MNKDTDRQRVIRRLVTIRREMEGLIKLLTTTDALRDFALELDTKAFGEPHHYKGPESAEVVAERWGISLEPESGDIPDWVRAKMGHHMADTLTESVE